LLELKFTLYPLTLNLFDISILQIHNSHNTIAVSLVILPRALILNGLIRIEVLSVSMSFSIKKLTIVYFKSIAIALEILQLTFSMILVVTKLSYVETTIAQPVLTHAFFLS